MTPEQILSLLALIADLHQTVKVQSAEINTQAAEILRLTEELQSAISPDS